MGNPGNTGPIVAAVRSHRCARIPPDDGFPIGRGFALVLFLVLQRILYQLIHQVQLFGFPELNRSAGSRMLFERMTSTEIVRVPPLSDRCG